MCIASALILPTLVAFATTEIVPPAGATPGFGTSIDRSSEFLIIGTSTGNNNKGHVAIYANGNSTSPVWTLDVSGLSNDAAAGQAVGIDGDWAAIGIPGDNKTLILKYEDNGSGPQWTENEWLTPPPGIQQFGYSIDMHREEMLIGAPEGFEAVAGYRLETYEFPDGSTQLLWNNYGVIESPLPSGSRWGHSVTVEDGTGFVGSPSYNGTDGNLHRLRLDGPFMTIEEDLTFEIPWATGQIGWDVIIRNGQLYVSAPSYGLNDSSGIVWMLRNLEQDDGTLAWSFNAYLSPPIEILQSQFGYMVDSNESVVAISAPYAEGKGAIYLYDCDFEDPNFPTFPYLGQIQLNDLNEGDLFGSSFVMGDTYVFCGSTGSDLHGPDHGRVSIVNQSDIQPPANQSVSYDTATALDTFDELVPSAISVSGNRVVLGVPHAAGGNGLVQLVDNQNGSWVLDAELFESPDGVPNIFGFSVSQSEHLLAVGAPGTNGSGAVHVYDQSDDGYEKLTTISPSMNGDIAFGYSVEMYKSDPDIAYLVIGSPGISLANGQIVSPGHCYIYRAFSSDFSSWEEIFSRTSNESASLLGIDVALDQTESGLVMAVGDPSFLQNKGATWLYTGDATSETWTDLPSIGGEAPGSFFGYSVDIEDKYVVSGAPGQTAASQTGSAYVVALVNGELSQWHVLTPAAQDSFNSFGESVAITREGDKYRVAASISGYRSGSGSVPSWTGSAVDMFTGKMQKDGLLGSMKSNGRIVTPGVHIPNGLGSIVSFQDSCLYMVNSHENAQALGTASKGVAQFDKPNHVYWLQANGGQFNNPDNWSVEPSDGDTLVFSLLGTTRYLVELSNAVDARLKFIYDKIILVSNDEFNETVRSIDIASEATVEAASLIIGGGLLNIEEDLRIGSDEQDMAGSLYLAVNGRVNCGNLIQSANGQMGYGINTLTDENNWVIESGNIELAGSFRVEIIADLANQLSAGDVFHFIRSSSAPPPEAQRHDVMVLPGLPNGLAMVPRYNESVNTSGWEMLLDIVDLGGLLSFDDPNSIDVDSGATAVEIVDLNGDGAEEICLVFSGTPGSLIIFENDGAGGVTQQVVMNTGGDPVDITSGDFDGDGTSDLAVANSADQDIYVYYNEDQDISNGFTELDLDINRTPTCLAGIDYDFNSEKDLVVGVTDDDLDGNGDWLFYTGTASLSRAGGFNSGGSTPSLGVPIGVDPSEDEKDKDIPFAGRKSNGKASIARFVMTNSGPSLELVEYVVGADPGGMDIADINNDGFADIMVTSTTNGTIALLIQNSASPGTFDQTSYVAIGISPTGTTAVDFDLDGDVDIATITNNESGNRIIRVLQNDGNLSFTSVDVAEGEYPLLVDTGDIDGDGSQKLVSISGSGSALRNGALPSLALRSPESGCQCPGDANCDGTINIDDILGVIANFGCTSDCEFDADNDGDSDIDDLLTIISNWGSCI
ncbi:MAG: hypothetical protein CMJ40_08865 [Phycisphaerae bacterium]|nr:hypothetical protein [Phycisphaerae bacterium]